MNRWFSGKGQRMRLPTSVSYAARRAAAVVAVSAGLGLAACTGGSPPPAPPSTSTSSVPATATTPVVTSSTVVTTTSAAPSTTSLPYPSDVPAAARVNSPEGAMAFVRHFIGVLNAVYQRPEVGRIPPLSLGSCQSCAGYEENVVYFSTNGQRYDRPPIAVAEISMNPESAPPGPYIVDVVIDQVPAKVLNRDGEVVQSVKATRAILVFTVRHDGTVPRVALVQVQK